MPSDLRRGVMPFGGVRIIESDQLVEGPFEDWSRVRSHARAKRRRTKHRQNIRFFYTPSTTARTLPDGSIIMHPEMAKQLRAHITEDHSHAG